MYGDIFTNTPSAKATTKFDLQEFVQLLGRLRQPRQLLVIHPSLKPALEERGKWDERVRQLVQGKMYLGMQWKFDSAAQARNKETGVYEPCVYEVDLEQLRGGLTGGSTPQKDQKYGSYLDEFDLTWSNHYFSQERPLLTPLQPPLDK